MVAFLFFGDQVLKLFGVDVESFAVAGATILFIIAFEMILGVQIFKNDQDLNLDYAVELRYET
jgi:multiple antibiotic resistance protein